MKVLAIGNSFSTDATAYLHDIAAADDFDLTVVNLYIGGCSLETHWNNIVNDAPAYLYELNGQETKMASIKEALEEADWDYVTMQQFSGLSGIQESYYPYIANISNYVKKLAPSATQIIHQTWAYDIGCQHDAFSLYGNDQQSMYLALKKAYQAAADDLKLDIIPCGDIIQAVRSHPLFDLKKGGQSLCRDGFHMHLIYGRYLTAAAWYEKLAKRSILSNNYLPPSDQDTIVDVEKIMIIKQYVHKIISS